MDYTPGPAASALLLGLLLMLPVALTLQFRSNAMSAPSSNRTVAWFEFVRSLRWTLIGALILWWAATDFVRLRGYTMDVSEAVGWGDSTPGFVLSLFLAWLPMFFILVLCTIVAHPVYAGVRGLTWTPRELAKLALLRLGCTYVPLLLMVASVRSMVETASLRDFLCCFAAAAVIYLASARMLRAAMQWNPEALLSGDLRDRGFALAKNMGAKLNQIYVMPAGRMQMANAFASSANAVLLTDYLLSNLSRREVDAIVAHELSHIKHGHARTRGVIAGLLGAGIGWWYASAGDVSYLPLLDIGFSCALLFGLYFLSRRFEFTADSEGARLTGDPEALITGLAKVHALNVFPIRWGKWTEKTMTHPSTIGRAEAIARATGYPLERVPIALESALTAPASEESQTADRYLLPLNVAVGTKVFSTQCKRRLQWQGFLASLVTITVVPAAAVRVIQAIGAPRQGGMIFAVAFCVTSLFWAARCDYAAMIGQRALKERLREKLEREGAQPEAWKGVFVSLSPDASVRAYDGNNAWDLGYLFLAGDRLFFWGEATRFALGREQIESVQLGPGMPSLLGSASIYVTWSNAATGKLETFRMGQAEGRSMRAMASGTRALEKRMEDWVACRTAGSMGEATSVPAALALLGPPAIGAVTGTPARHYGRAGQVISSMVIMGFVAGSVCAMLGIPVDVTSPIATVTGLVEPQRADFLGWYAVFASLLIVILSFSPFWFHRDLKIEPTTQRAQARAVEDLK